MAPSIIPAGSQVRILDIVRGAYIPGTVERYQGGNLVVNTGDGGPLRLVSPEAAVIDQLAPVPAPPRSAGTIMQQEGVGGPQAVRKAAAERAAYEAEARAAAEARPGDGWGIPFDWEEAPAAEERSPRAERTADSRALIDALDAYSIRSQLWENLVGRALAILTGVATWMVLKNTYDWRWWTAMTTGLAIMFVTRLAAAFLGALIDKRAMERMADKSIRDRRDHD